MDMSEVKAFNAELSGLYDNKPPISKAKMSAITRGAIKAIKFYKHVVHSVEKFIQKCKPEYKVPGLYVIDSIVRQSRHQFGQDKDVFAPRFAKNMQQTFANLFRCPPEDKRNIIRVLNLWQKNSVFGADVIQPLMDMADPNHPLHAELAQQQQQQNSTANGSTLNASHNTTDKQSPAGQQHTPHASTPMGDSWQDQPSGIPSGGKFNRKLLNDFDYDSDDEPQPSVNRRKTAIGTTFVVALVVSGCFVKPHGGCILTNPEIMRQLQTLQAQMQMMTGMQIPNLMPMMSEMQQNQNQNLPFLSSQDQQKQNDPNKDDGANESDIEFVETGPQVIEIPDANDSRSPSPKSRRHRSRSRSPRRRRRGSRSRSKSPRRRRDRDRDRERDKDREKNNKEREADREKQKEREKKGLPPIKKENLSVCSTTLWVGHLSKLATQEELSDLFGSHGGVVSIDVVAPRGCAFVVMERRRDAYKALTKLNKHKLHSKEITSTRAIRAIGFLYSEGSIDVVAPRGCAFVVMERRRDAYKALTKLNKHKLHSKEITVSIVYYNNQSTRARRAIGCLYSEGSKDVVAPRGCAFVVMERRRDAYKALTKLNKHKLHSKEITSTRARRSIGCLYSEGSIDVVAPRGCAFVVMERRRDAYKALTKLNKHKLHSKEITVSILQEPVNKSYQAKGCLYSEGSIDVVAPRGCAFVVMERRRDAYKALTKLNKHKLHFKEVTECSEIRLFAKCLGPSRRAG
ncbi:RNA recognition motif domain-containing protein [Phthorimaea operculella]|nr:RNA recognition motif domain-containing protein [Phthorimaea operculella]